MRVMACVCVLMAGLMMGCAGTQVAGTKARGYLRLDVTPKNARIHLDGRYAGEVDGWAAQTIVVTPGVHMLELRSPGFISQRFDIEVAAGEEVSLTLEMEPVLEEYVEEEKGDE